MREDQEMNFGRKFQWGLCKDGWIILKLILEKQAMKM